METDFITFLIKKKIDPQSFKKNEEKLFLEWQEQYKLQNEESFVMQKKFLINKIRRKYIIQEKA